MARDHDAGQCARSDRDRWTNLFCTCGWCRGERWIVRQDPRSPQLWQIAEAEGASPWSVASREPVCPLCGDELVAHVEGVGEPEMAIDNPFVRYIRTLKRAA